MHQLHTNRVYCERAYGQVRVVIVLTIRCMGGDSISLTGHLFAYPRPDGNQALVAIYFHSLEWGGAPTYTRRNKKTIRINNGIFPCIEPIKALLGFRFKRSGRVLVPLAAGCAALGAPFLGVASLWTKKRVFDAKSWGIGGILRRCTVGGGRKAGGGL